MNRYIRRTHGFTDAADNWLKTIDLASMSARPEERFIHFADEKPSASPPWRENLCTAKGGQNIDTNQPLAPTTATTGSVPRRPARVQPDDHPAANTREPAEKAGQKAGRGGGARKGSAGRRQREKSPNQKHQRAAEARQRYELLEEERELMDNVADFWDERFDKPRRQRVPLPPWDMHKIQAPAVESDGNDANRPRAPRNRSSRR